MRSKIIILSVFIILLIVAGLLTGVFSLSIVSAEETSSHKLVLQKMEDIGKLELVRYNFNDVVEEGVKRKLLDVDDFAPDSKVLLIINGEAAACINLKEVKLDDIEITDKRLIVTLPQPEICYAKVNHNKSKVYDVNFTARILNPELIAKGFKNAEKRIEEDALSMGILEKARENAEKVLVPILSAVSEKEVRLLFSHQK